jgi:hypothetical protein
LGPGAATSSFMARFCFTVSVESRRATATPRERIFST